MRPAPILVLAASVVIAHGCTDHHAPMAPPASTATVEPAHHASLDFDLALPGIELGSGITADLVARVYVDERHGHACGSRGTVLAVYGFAHTAATWEPLANAVFGASWSPICRIIAVDLPGHGASGLPVGTAFGLLTLGDYARAVLGTLTRLHGRGLSPRAIIAHSQGGMVVQLAQQQLIDGGMTLRQAHGIDAVVLLAPTMPAALPWAFAADPATLQLLGQFLVPADPTLGPHFAIPDPVWTILFFSRLDGTLAANAPSAADIAARGYNAPEPFLSGLELLGAFGASRPAIDAGIFSLHRGTVLSTLAFENDQIIRPMEAQALHRHLTGLPGVLLFRTIGGSEAVHDMFVSDPGGLLAGIFGGMTASSW